MTEIVWPSREARGGDGGGVLAVQGDARLGEGLANGGGVGAQGAFLAVGHEGHGAFGADGEGQAGAGDPGGAGRGEVRPLGPDPELAQRPGHGVGGRPDPVADAVEGEGDGPPVLDDHLVAVAGAGAGGRGDAVVRADGDALLLQQLGDVVREGVQGPGRAVDLQADGLVVGDERGGAAGQEGDDQGPGTSRLSFRFSGSATKARRRLAARRASARVGPCRGTADGVGGVSGVGGVGGADAVGGGGPVSGASTNGASTSGASTMVGACAHTLSPPPASAARGTRRDACPAKCSRRSRRSRRSARRRPSCAGTIAEPR